jgi:hypothetical protein
MARWGKRAERDGHALEFIYDTGSRTLEDDADGSDQKMSSHRLTLQYARGLGQGFELLVRGTPLTSRINFDRVIVEPRRLERGRGNSLGAARILGSGTRGACWRRWIITMAGNRRKTNLTGWSWEWAPGPRIRCRAI